MCYEALFLVKSDQQHLPGKESLVRKQLTKYVSDVYSDKETMNLSMKTFVETSVFTRQSNKVLKERDE